MIKNTGDLDRPPAQLDVCFWDLPEPATHRS
jgi:hypothetical protein